MSEKLDLLIKECGDYFDAELVKLEVKYKKFTEDYNKAITNTQEFEIYKANGDDTKIWPKDVFPDKPEPPGTSWLWASCAERISSAAAGTLERCPTSRLPAPATCCSAWFGVWGHRR